MNENEDEKKDLFERLGAKYCADCGNPGDRIIAEVPLCEACHVKQLEQLIEDLEKAIK